MNVSIYPVWCFKKDTIVVYLNYFKFVNMKTEVMDNLICGEKKAFLTTLGYHLRKCNSCDSVKNSVSSLKTCAI